MSGTLPAAILLVLMVLASACLLAAAAARDIADAGVACAPCHIGP